MSLLARLARFASKPSSKVSHRRPRIEPLEGRQLLSASFTQTVDLAVTQVRNPVLPAALKVGRAPRGNAVVDLQNVGLARFKGKVTIQLQLTADGQWSDTNPLLKTVTRNFAGVRVSGKRSISLQLPKIPTGIPQGAYRIAARITVVGEDASAAGNNTGAGWKTNFTGTPGVTNPIPTPPSDPNPTPPTDPTPTPTYVDLAVAPTVTESRFEGGMPLTVTVTIKNVGTAAVHAPMAIDLWAGPDSGDTRGDDYLGGGGTVLDLAPGESTTFDVTGTMSTVLTGTAYIRAEMYDVELAELGDVNRANDQTATGPIEVWHKDVDLSATWAFADDPAQSILTVQGDSVVKVQVNVTNSGSETFTGPLELWTWAQAGMPLKQWQIHPQTVDDVTIGAGETKTLLIELPLSTTYPGILPPGDYDLTGSIHVNYHENGGGTANNKMPAGLVLHVE